MPRDNSGPKKSTWSRLVESDADLTKTERFPQIISQTAGIPKHQLGWRMAILPFRGRGESVSYSIALGMAEEVSAAVSRYQTPRLIAPATFWDGTGPAEDVLGRCKMYQLDYIADSSIEIQGDQIRIDMTLLDVVLDFEVIWAGCFTGHRDNLSDLREQISLEIVNRLDPDLLARGPASEAPIQTSVAAAHHAVLTAIHGIYRLDRPQFMRAREYLSHAIVLDPKYGAAHAWLAYWSVIAVGLGWVDDPQEITLLAGRSADQAVRLDPSDARAMAIAGHVKGYLLHQVSAALDLHRRAIALNPNLPIAWTVSAWSKLYNGEHATAIRHAMTAQSLSPRDPHIFFSEHALMTAYFFKKDLEQAEVIASVVLSRNPGHLSALNVRLAILGHMGRSREAAECLAELHAIQPQISVARIVSRAPLRPDDRAFYVDGLIRAGVAA